MLPILDIGDPLLRQAARPLSLEEIRAESVQELIVQMRETMRSAPGVGLAAPQVGEALQLIVVEDREEYMRHLTPEWRRIIDRHPVPFQVLINPQLTPMTAECVEYFEGCLSVCGAQLLALVPRKTRVRLEALNEHAEEVVIEAEGWFARILQHEVDHLQGTLFVDRMDPRTCTNVEHFRACWAGKTGSEVRRELGLPSHDSPR